MQKYSMPSPGCDQSLLPATLISFRLKADRDYFVRSGNPLGSCLTTHRRLLEDLPALWGLDVILLCHDDPTERHWGWWACRHVSQFARATVKRIQGWMPGMGIDDWLDRQGNLALRRALPIDWAGCTLSPWDVDPLALLLLQPDDVPPSGKGVAHAC
jgi:hypothetical protein